MNLSKERIEQLKNFHQLGWKVKKVAEELRIAEVHALEQMNMYLHNLYRSYTML